MLTYVSGGSPLWAFFSMKQFCSNSESKIIPRNFLQQVEPDLKDIMSSIDKTKSQPKEFFPMSFLLELHFHNISVRDFDNPLYHQNKECWNLTNNADINPLDNWSKRTGAVNILPQSWGKSNLDINFIHMYCSSSLQNILQTI